MDNAARLAIYQRNGSTLTPAQRRRLNRHARRVEHHVVIRASRLRKAMERAETRRLRGEATELITAMRRGWLRQSTQAMVRRSKYLDILRRAVRS